MRKAGTLLCAINLGGIAPGDVNSVDVIERICGDDVLPLFIEESLPVILFFFVVILLLTEVIEDEPESEELVVENKFVEGDPEEVDEEEE